MSKDKCIEVLGDWEGYTVGTVGRFESDEEGCPGRVEIELLGIAGRRMACSVCGEEVESVHDVSERWVRDLPILDADTWPLVYRFRVLSPHRAPKEICSKIERIPSRYPLSLPMASPHELVGRHEQ